MESGWLGYDTARVDALRQHIVAAADDLESLAAIGAPAGVADVIGRIVSALRVHWGPLVLRITTDATLTTWFAADRDAGLMSVVPHPPDGTAAGVARWWEGLSDSQRSAVIHHTPAVVGNLDGVPAWARDVANRRMLAEDLGRLGSSAATGTLSDADAAMLANARAADLALAASGDIADPRTGAPVTVQLYLYEPAAYDGDGRVAIAIGDLDQARHIAVAVPGMGTEASTLGTSVPEVVYAAATGYTAEPIAVMTWHGYDAPSIAVMDGNDDDPIDDAADWIAEVGDLADVVTIGRATSGAAALAGDVSGLRAMRDRDDVHLTVIGNSYGSTTVAIAADEFALAADDVVLTGSPGAGRAGNAGDLTTGTTNTWVGSASDDPVSYLGRTGGAEPHDVADFVNGVQGVGLGNDPAEDDFGAQRFQAEWVGRDDDFPWPLAGHGHYFDPCAEAAGSIGAIVAADYGAVALAERRHKDETWDPWDPLGDLLPADPEANAPVDGDNACSSPRQ
jgi:hypothetical protein